MTNKPQYLYFQYALDGASDAGVGRVQRGHMRRMRAAGQPRLVPRLPLVGRSLQCRDALCLQTIVPRASFHEYNP